VEANSTGGQDSRRAVEQVVCMYVSSVCRVSSGLCIGRGPKFIFVLNPKAYPVAELSKA
jgi:hypothetical protein